MSNDCKILALLADEGEPSQSLYNGVVESIINDPQQISRLTQGHVKDAFLIHVTTRGYRLARVFDGLRRAERAYPMSTTIFNLAAEIVTFLILILPDLDQLLGPTKVLEFLVPALELCFAPSRPPSLRKLAAVLGECGTVLEHLSSHRSGSKIVRQWVSMPNTSALATETWGAWTGRLVDMVSSCPGYHDVAHSIQQWATLIALKGILESLEERLRDNESSRPPSGNEQETRGLFPPLNDETKGMLKTFGLALPGSRRLVQSHIETLNMSRIPVLLRSIAASFPCKRCIPSSGSAPRSTNVEIHDESVPIISDLHIDVLGKSLGMWKVRLSAPALKSIQNLSRLGLFSPVKEKLTDLASGCWKSSLAGSNDQRRHLKVPLASTKCGQNVFILWQVDIGLAEDMKAPQQVIVVWEVGNSDATSKAIVRVTHLQGSYSDEIVRRCRQRPTIRNGNQIPARFEDSALQSTRPETSSADFDVRTVDQDTIDMANKFYALTEPVIRSVLENDLAAEFPFDLSREEARVITHFQTASLILGRSGTGKTTCLVFKLVGKFLASKAVLDERPVRQVLLTRSSFLADRLEAYTRRLIETLLSKSHHSESFEAEELLLSRKLEELSDGDSVLKLRDQNFPLICTFDRFLQILENTTIELDRQNMEEVPSHPIQGVQSTKRPHQNQLVDFYAFKVDYWPRFPQTLTKNLSVNLVFAEIMGVIKGSVSSRMSLAPIPREDYLTRSCRMAPAFVSEAERLCVYEIFELYEKKKMEWGDADYVDRVVRILRAVRRDSSLHQLLRSTFDEIYIDEIQDQRCLDIELFLSFIKDGRGFHLAGDTAQAISHDSTIRFSDIKRLFHEHFAETGVSTKQSELGKPQLFTLSKNYRSHQGILSLASLVMGMIWKSFPETVDKLDPEVGNLSGPKPVLFVGCDVDILLSSNVGSTKFSERAADFGAEQVIIVRDTRSKTSLQGQVGELALILTILESKGMEFDDVILWNFFSECPDQAGLRSLNALKKDVHQFDSRKHGGMCSELKHLYVAITRARSQLFIVENSEPTGTMVLELLTEGSLGPLVEATRPSLDDFDVRVEMLRPNTSVDPTAWLQRADELMRRRMFKEALMAFRRAEDSQGQTRAQGFLKEEEGKLCDADNDTEGFNLNMRTAVGHFLEVKLIGDAVRVLVALGELGEAAALWFERGQYKKAAPLFADAQLYLKASDCHRLLGQHSEVAATLRQGRLFDHLVSYLDKHFEDIPSDTLRSYSLLCKLLLKQKKISSECRKHAIRLLGSSDEQEACFIEYGLDEQLAEFYAEKQRHKDLYYLYYKTGQLEKALKIAMTNRLWNPTSGISEAEMLNVLDYVWAGYMQGDLWQNIAATLELPLDALTPNTMLSNTEWDSSHTLYSSQATNARRLFSEIDVTVAKKVLGLRKILDLKAISRVKVFDDIPFDLMREAIKLAKDIVLNDNCDASKILLLLTGIWKPDDTQDRCILLLWSPLHKTLASMSRIHAFKDAKTWFLDGLVSAVLTLDTKARELWKLKWPTHCVQFLTPGFCLRQRKKEKCEWKHQPVSGHDCSQKIEDLLQVNAILCELAAIYYRRVMNGNFQERYLGMRRHWLERLLRGLTYLSAVEQHASGITKTQTELFRGQKSLDVSSSLEELLYFRLKNEWSKRSNCSSLMEQMQLAQAFGSNVQNSLFRALSHRLRMDKRQLLQRHLALLSSFKNDIASKSASVFQSNLNTFLQNLDNIDVKAFSTLHALTAEFEYLAAYLILKTSLAACVLTQAWIDLYVPRFADAIHSVEQLPSWEWRHLYQDCLVELTMSFCRILCRFNKAPRSENPLLCSGKFHDAFLLRQRNAELVAILIANLASAGFKLPAHFWTTAQEVFECGFIRASHLKSSTPFELTSKLAPSLLKYNGKDGLVLVIKDRKSGSILFRLEHQAGINTVSFDELCPRAPSLTYTEAPAAPPLISSTDGPQEEYTESEIDAVAKIRQWWLSHTPKLRHRRSYISLPQYRAMARLFNMSTQCLSTIRLQDRAAIQRFLLSRGVSLCLRLGAAWDLVSKQQEDAMACAGNVDTSLGGFESVDAVLGRNRDVEALLKKVEAKMSDEYLEGLMREGVLSVLEKAMKDVENDMTEAEKEMSETRKMIDVVSRNCNIGTATV